MKIKPAAKKGNLIVEIDPRNTRLNASFSGPIIGLKEILVPIDFSDCSMRAARYAEAFAAQFDARVTLLSVIQETKSVFDYGNAEHIASLDFRKKKYSDELARVAKTGFGNCKTNFLVRVGRPFEEIVSAAAELNSDLIIIATHGHMGLPDGLLGSTTERVVRFAPCPVLVVREKEKDFAPAK
jgi:universal stress protein A